MINNILDNIPYIKMPFLIDVKYKNSLLYAYNFDKLLSISSR